MLLRQNAEYGNTSQDKALSASFSKTLTKSGKDLEKKASVLSSA